MPGRSDTAELIARLADAAEPVRLLRPPMLRAAAFIAAVLAAAAAAILLFARPDAFAARAADPYLPLELAGTLLTGILSAIAAFHLSVPDRSARWALLPLPGLALWLAGSGLGCARHLSVGGDGGEGMRASMNCVMFILGFGLPLMAATLLVLRRARPLAPAPVAATGGLSAAAFAAFLLEFFHPFDISLMDLALHAAAVAALILLATSRCGARLLGAPDPTPLPPPRPRRRPEA
jgi:hypothetical protein